MLVDPASGSGETLVSCVTTPSPLLAALLDLWLMYAAPVPAAPASTGVPVDAPAQVSVAATAAPEQPVYVSQILTAASEPVFTPVPTPTPAPTPMPAPAPTPAPPPANIIAIRVGGEAYLGDAQFQVTVDSVRVGGIYTATARYDAGEANVFTLPGTYGAGPHVVDISFINDLFGGPGLDRNLFVTGAGLNGVIEPYEFALTAQDQTASIVLRDGTPPSPAPASRPGNFQYLGVNLSGAEFGVGGQYYGGVNIGTNGTDYTFPTANEVAYYASQNLNVIRLPFSWERLQPTQNGAFDQTYLAQIDGVVQQAAARGVSVVIDPHNYGYGYGALIGSAGTPGSAFANLWSQLAHHYKGNANVLFGLMNEPHEQSPAEWVAPVNAAIAAIRNAGATQEILVPGTHYTGGDSWLTSGNADIFAANVIDPLHNMAFEIHQYADADQSGSSAAVVSPTIGADRLTAVTAWAERTGNRLFLGEFGAGSDPASLATLTNMLGFMQQHAVWQGGTEWGGGPWWGDYALATDPVAGVTMPQVNVLHSFMPLPSPH